MLESIIRRVLASGLVAVGVLCALSAGVFRYVDQHFHTPETFLANTSSLADNAEIRERLFEGFRSEIVALAEGETDADAGLAEDTTDGDSLLPGIGSEADSDDAVLDGSDPITEERIARDQAIEEILLDTFDSDLYDEVFTAALISTQEQVVRSADLESAELLRDKGQINFDMRRLYPTIYLRLAADERTAEITQNEVPPEYGIFPVADRETTINFLWSLIRNGPSWRTLTFAGAIMSLIGAVVIAERRPSTAIQFGGGMAGVGVVVIVVVYLIRFIVPLLAGGGSSAAPVVATYAANLWPLVRLMIRLVILGLIVASVGAIARLIWPDDWVYGSVSDERGIRSFRRRHDEPEPEQPTQQVPVAAAVPVGYPYGQPYPGYQAPWGQPYPGQAYPPGYAQPYPAGPYAQPAQPPPQHYTSPGRPTVPVMPVSIEAGATVADEMVPPAAPPLDGSDDPLPKDAAQVVPRVVATTDGEPHPGDPDQGDVAPSEPTAAAAGHGEASPPAAAAETAESGSDEWAEESDW